MVNHPAASVLRGGATPLKLRDVCKTVMTTAFQSVPNPNDPLFVHLRIMANNDVKHRQVYGDVAQTLAYWWPNALYTDPRGKAVAVTGETPLGDVMGKIVVICDKTQNPDYADPENYEACRDTCHTLADYVNVESGTRTLHLRYYNALKLQAATPPTMEADDPLRTDVTKWYIVIPYVSENLSNINTLELTKNYGAQMCAAMFYFDDAPLTQYENAFNAQKCAFVPLSTMITM
jgi:hypothetical protein